jgi:signal transduction histidine kinase
MTDNFRNARRDRRWIALETGDAEAENEVDGLRAEVESLRASRRRLVLAADADRRSIERELHNGVQQHLVALAVNVQLAGRLADTDPAAARTLLQQLERDVRETLDATAQLAQRIYPPLLEPRGLAAVLRSAAAAAGVVASVNVAAGTSYPPEDAASVYSCWQEALETVGAERASITVRDDGAPLDVEVVARGGRAHPGLERLRDRVEALGGRLTTTAGPTAEIRISCALPLPE